jgi:putative redox protein
MADMVTVTLGKTDFEITGTVRQHKVIIDEPLSNGGQDKGPSPTEYLCISLASCTTATLKIYANYKKITITAISVEVEMVVTEDKKNIFRRKVKIEGNFDSTVRERLLQIANSCPVHKILSQANTVETELV